VYDKAIRRITTAGLLIAITMLLVFTRIGMIPVPTPAANATIAHIPAIIGGILEGPVVGLVVGMTFGFASFTSASIPMFKDPLIAVLPRLLIGLTSAWAFMALQRLGKTGLRVLTVVLLVLFLVFAHQIYSDSQWLAITVAAAATAVCGGLLWWLQREEPSIVSLAVSAVVGSLTNTVLVLGVATLRGYLPVEAAWGVGLTHGIPEAIVSAIVVVAVVSAVRQVGRSRQRSRLQREDDR